MVEERNYDYFYTERAISCKMEIKQVLNKRTKPEITNPVTSQIC